MGPLGGWTHYRFVSPPGDRQIAHVPHAANLRRAMTSFVRVTSSRSSFWGLELWLATVASRKTFASTLLRRPPKIQARRLRPPAREARPAVAWEQALDPGQDHHHSDPSVHILIDPGTPDDLHSWPKSLPHLLARSYYLLER
jgi:hypothetical protein